MNLRGASRQRGLSTLRAMRIPVNCDRVTLENDRRVCSQADGDLRGIEPSLGILKEHPVRGSSDSRGVRAVREHNRSTSSLFERSREKRLRIHGPVQSGQMQHYEPATARIVATAAKSARAPGETSSATASLADCRVPPESMNAGQHPAPLASTRCTQLVQRPRAH